MTKSEITNVNPCLACKFTYVTQIFHINYVTDVNIFTEFIELQ